MISDTGSLLAWSRDVFRMIIDFPRAEHHAIVLFCCEKCFNECLLTFSLGSNLSLSFYTLINHLYFNYTCVFKMKANWLCRRVFKFLVNFGSTLSSNISLVFFPPPIISFFSSCFHFQMKKICTTSWYKLRYKRNRCVKRVNYIQYVNAFVESIHA